MYEERRFIWPTVFGVHSTQGGPVGVRLLVRAQDGRGASATQPPFHTLPSHEKHLSKPRPVPQAFAPGPPPNWINFPPS